MEVRTNTHRADPLRSEAQEWLRVYGQQRKKHSDINDIGADLQMIDGQGSTARAIMQICGSCTFAKFLLQKNNLDLHCPIVIFPGRAMKRVPFGETFDCPDYSPQKMHEYAQSYANFLSQLKFKRDEYRYLFDSLVSAGVHLDGVKNDIVALDMKARGKKVFYSDNRFGANDDKSDFLLKTELLPQLVVGNKLIGKLLPAESFFINPWCFDESQVVDLTSPDPAQQDYLTTLRVIYLQMPVKDRQGLRDNSWLALP